VQDYGGKNFFSFGGFSCAFSGLVLGEVRAHFSSALFAPICDPRTNPPSVGVRKPIRSPTKSVTKVVYANVAEQGDWQFFGAYENYRDYLLGGGVLSFLDRHASRREPVGRESIILISIMGSICASFNEHEGVITVAVLLLSFLGWSSNL